MSNPAGHEDFVDTIYQASVDPDLWPTVLDRLVDLIGGEAATLHWYDIFTGSSTGVGVRVDQIALDKAFADFAPVNPLTVQDGGAKRRGCRNFVPRIIRDTDWLPKEDFLRTAYYNDFFQAFGFHSDVGLGIMAEDVGGGVWEGAGINVFRHKRKGPWSDDDMALCASLHSHLIRAYKLGRKISTQRRVGESLTEFVDGARNGLFLLDGHGRIGHFNAAGRALLSEVGGLTIIGGRLTATRQDDARRLQDLIARAASGDREQRAGGSMGLSTPCRRRPLSLIISPMRGDRAALFPSAPAVVVCVTDLEAGARLSEQQLRDVFGLTAAEVRVALSLLEGLEPQQIAHRLDVSLPTVRTHLSHTFEKTGTTGQAALTGLMTRMSGLAPA